MIKVVLYLYRTGPSVSWTMRRVSRPLRLMGRRSLARRSFWQQRPARSSRGSRQIPYSLGLGPCDGLSDGRMCSASACSSASWAMGVWVEFALVGRDRRNAAKMENWIVSMEIEGTQPPTSLRPNNLI